MIEDVTTSNPKSANASLNFCLSAELPRKVSLSEAVAEETGHASDKQFKQYKWDQSTQGVILRAFLHLHPVANACWSSVGEV